MNNTSEIGKLDSLFKGAAIDYELPFNEEAWSLMEKKLDNSQKRKPMFLWWITAAIIFGGVAFYAVSKFGTNNANNPQENNSATINNSINANEIAPEQKNAPLTTNEEENNVNKPDANSEKESNIANSAKSFNLESKKDITKKIISSHNYQPSTLKTKESFIKKTDNQNTISTPINTKKEFIGKENAPTKTSMSINEVNDKLAAINVSNNITERKYFDKMEYLIEEKSATRYYTAQNLPLHNRYVTDFEKLATENQEAVNKLEEKLGMLSASNIKNSYSIPSITRNDATNNWYVLAAIGSNIGYVSNPAIKDASLQYQIAVGYNINKHLSVTAGLAIGKRAFDMRRDQFTYKGNPSYDKSIKSINANISLVDLPINLRYQFSNKENDGWFVTTGISTLFLKEENYKLLIDNASGSPFLYDQNFTNTTSKLSMLNLSLGYQYAFSNNFSLVVEPYVQLPFKSIGGGGMKLSSVGLQIGGKYSFNKKKK